MAVADARLGDSHGRDERPSSEYVCGAPLALTAKLPALPVTVPAVCVPSPQSIVAVKSEAVRLVSMAVNVATSLLNAVPSVGEIDPRLTASGVT